MKKLKEDLEMEKEIRNRRKGRGRLKSRLLIRNWLGERFGEQRM